MPSKSFSTQPQNSSQATVRITDPSLKHQGQLLLLLPDCYTSLFLSTWPYNSVPQQALDLWIQFVFMSYLPLIHPPTTHPFIKLKNKVLGLQRESSRTSRAAAEKLCLKKQNKTKPNQQHATPLLWKNRDRRIMRWSCQPGS